MTQATARLTPADTKTRILDAAEALFIDGGFDSLSMRQITTSASVNLAAVNYHFGSKDALIEAVLARQLDPLNDARNALLSTFEGQLGDRMTCEHVLIAMFLPAVRASRSGTLVPSGFFTSWGARTPIRLRWFAPSSTPTISKRWRDSSSRFRRLCLSWIVRIWASA